MPWLHPWKVYRLLTEAYRLAALFAPAAPPKQFIVTGQARSRQETPSLWSVWVDARNNKRKASALALSGHIILLWITVSSLSSGPTAAALRQTWPKACWRTLASRP